MRDAGKFYIQKIVSRRQIFHLQAYLKIVDDFGFHFQLVSDDGVQLNGHLTGDGLLKFHVYKFYGRVRINVGGLQYIAARSRQGLGGLPKRGEGHQYDKDTRQ